MVKKFKAAGSKFSNGAAGMFDPMQMTAAARESAQQILSAGMSAFSKAQGEGQKVISSLIKEGAGFSKRSRGAAQDAATEITGKVSHMATNVTKQANETWDKLEQVFEERVARALSRLGVPTAAEIAELTAQVNGLTAALEKSTGSKVSAKPVKAAAKKAVKTVKAAPAKAVKAVKSVTKAATKATTKAAKPVAKKATKVATKATKAVKAAVEKAAE